MWCACLSTCATRSPTRPRSRRRGTGGVEMQMSPRVNAFDRWIRTVFVEMNTELENLYFAQADRSNVEGVGDSIKATLRDEGHAHIVALFAEGNTGDGFQSGFGVLGNVGMYLGALRRHELT